MVRDRLAAGLAGVLVLAVAAGASAASFAYVPNELDGTVSVIATATNTIVTTVTVGILPVGAAATPNGAYVYVTNLGSNAVSVIATATNTVVATVPVGIFPFGGAVTPKGAFVYVTSLGTGTVSVIAPATNTVGPTVPVGTSPAGVAVTPNGAAVYVANRDSNTVSVIATATNTVGATVPVGKGPAGVAVMPDGTHVYVGNVVDNTVSVIDTVTNTVVATVPVGQFPLALGQFIQTITSVPFAAFSPRVEVAASTGAFEVNSTFTLGAGSAGNYPLTATVTLQLAAVTITIPAGSFLQGPGGKFVFEGVINGVTLEAIITPLDGGGFAFRAEGAGASGLPTTSAVTVGLTIGINTAPPVATAEFR